MANTAPIDEEKAPLTLGEVRERLRKTLAPDLFAHSLRVAQAARKLAAAYHFDADKAEMAALLHDIADPLSDGELLAHARIYRVAVGWLEISDPHQIHGKVGAEMARHD